jgi:hypothetical protein
MVFISILLEIFVCGFLDECSKEIGGYWNMDSHLWHIFLGHFIIEMVFITTNGPFLAQLSMRSTP